MTVVIVILFGLAVLCGLLASVGKWHSRRRAETVAAWPTSTALITSTDIIEQPMSWYRYMPWVTYNYAVQGQPFEGDRLRLGGRLAFARQHQALTYLEAFPAQARVKVWYDPRRPTLALLDPTPQSFVFRFFLIFAGLFSAMGLLFAVLSALPS